MYIVTWRNNEFRDWTFVKCDSAETAIATVQALTKKSSTDIEVWRAEKVEFEVTVKLA